MALLSDGALVGARCEGRRVPAVTIFGWDDVLCPTTHAKHDRAKRTAAVFEGRGLAAAQSCKEQRREVICVYLCFGCSINNDGILWLPIQQPHHMWHVSR